MRRPCVLAAVGLAFAGSVAAHAACEDLLPSRQTSSGPRRSVTPEDLVALRDVGFPDAISVTPESPLAVSPDGQRLAFVITRADKETNSYCRGLVVMDLGPGGNPKLVDRGGEFMPIVVSNRGLMVNTGAWEVVTPVWSPDGLMLAYRKRRDGRNEAWIAAADGSGARRIARLDVDIDNLGWSSDGRRVVVASRPGFTAQELAIAQEGKSGYLYDDRFQPNDASRPAVEAEDKRLAQTTELESGSIEVASEADAQRLPPELAKGLPAQLVAMSRTGRRAWLAPELKVLASPMRLWAAGADGQATACLDEACHGSIKSLMWIGGAVVFLHREGWARSVYALYRWVPGEQAPSRILATEEAVHGCVADAVGALCLVESATSTRRIVHIDLASGRRKMLFDPNPEFRAIRLGEVRRLKIRNAFGLEAWADLVLPPSYRGGRIPMVVTQYHSEGFLRGGTGDEYPVHAFAARGIAVLSIQRAPWVGELDPKLATNEKLTAGGTRDWAERKSLLSVIDLAVAESIRLGIADPKRLGITGLSDGSTSAAFALINSKLFAAAAISSCCMEPNTAMIYGGSRWADFNKAIGYPELGQAAAALWGPMSLARNASRLNAPLLIQAADREYLLALETWAALKQDRYPAEMYVYPDEYHNKWQPRHRFATYLRSLDWFDYWLAGKRDLDPSKAGQYRRWDELRRLRDARQGVAHGALEALRPGFDIGDP